MISVADLIVAQLRHAGVGFIFGVPGGGSNLDLIDAAGRAGLSFVLTATETAAALAAVAQAEIGGAPGACLTTLGPGVTSIVNGVACAWLDARRSWFHRQLRGGRPRAVHAPAHRPSRVVRGHHGRLVQPRGACGRRGDRRGVRGDPPLACRAWCTWIARRDFTTGISRTLAS